jgi:hypothetical protein
VYTWDFNTDDVERAFHELEPDAQAALLAVMDALMFDPAGYARRPDEPVGETVIHRMVGFGDRGQVSFYYWAPTLEVLVTQIQWAG